MTTVRLIGLLALFAAAAAAGQDPKPPANSAKPGEVVPANFRAYIVADDRFPPKVTPPVTNEDRDPRDRTNKMHCLVSENGLNPVVAVFVRADAKDLADKGVAKLAAAMNKIIPDYRADKLA